MEYLLLAVANDGLALTRLSGWWANLAYATQVAGFLGAGLAATLVLGGRSLLDDLAAVAADLQPIAWRWVFVHIVAFAGFALACARVFSPPPPAGVAALGLLVAWLATGATLVVALLRSLLGPALGAVFERIRGIALLGLMFGAAASVAADKSLALWRWLAGRTLAFAALLLAPFTDGLEVEPARAIVRLEDFAVRIAPGCSGIDGMTLIGLFMGGYLVRFGARHRFPNALVLIPLGIAAAWLANGVRIAGLLAIGAWVSPGVAHGGFHSKAGWLFFCFMAVGFAFLCQRFPLFSREAPQQDVAYENPTAAYCVPLLALLATGMLTSTFAEVLDPLYSLRLAAAMAALFMFRSYYAVHAWQASYHAVLVGVVVFGVWLLFLPGADPAETVAFETQLGQLQPWSRGVWLVTRVVGAVLVVPIAEELAFRGFLQRRLLAEDFTAVPLQRFGWWSFVATSLAFGSLHGNWVGGILASMAFSCAVYMRGRMADAVIAHATANALLCGWALSFGRWDLW